MDGLFIKVFNVDTAKQLDTTIYCGHLGLGWRSGGVKETHVMRFSMTIAGGKILNQHTSLLPTGDVSISLWNQQKDNNADFILS